MSNARGNQYTHTVFLCHSDKDKRFVRRLARDLRDFDIDAWFDEWELAPADSLHQTVGKALESSAFVAIVLSPDSLMSNWCKKELYQALTRESRTGSKVVIPLRYRRCTMPAFLEDKLYIDFSRSYLSALAQLICFLNGFKQKDLARSLESSQLRSRDDLRELIGDVSNIHPYQVDARTTLEELAKLAHPGIGPISLSCYLPTTGRIDWLASAELSKRYMDEAKKTFAEDVKKDNEEIGEADDSGET